MTSRASFRTTRPKGFTLIELMITVVVIAILGAVALPSFLNQIRKSRRTEARTAVLDLAARAERLYSTNNSYLNSVTSKLLPTDLGYQDTAFPIASVGSGYYSIDIKPNAPTATTFNFTATATGSQASDTTCYTFTVDQTGKQSAADKNNVDQTQTCWN
jgi:type IV pilus assembly protein PilE